MLPVVEGSRVRLEFESAADGAVVRLGDGARVGRFVLVERGLEVFVEELSIEPEHRGYGCGSEAARLLRRYAAAGSWARLTAWAPPDLGLAVYFWSRMGLRPLHGEGPNGGLSFVRELARDR